MGYVNISTSGHIKYGLKYFLCDTEKDIDNLSIEETMGSTAEVIETGNKYVLNSKRQWTLLPNTGGNGGSGGMSDEDLEEILNKIGNVEDILNSLIGDDNE